MHSIAIYIHWPFCKSKCPYCDFNSHTYTDISFIDWQRSYLQEIDYFRDLLSSKIIKSIYFGGGTPSLMPPAILGAILNKLSSISKFDDDIEITIEANPTSSDAAKFLEFRSTGINRISIGVQSLKANELQFLGRNHSVYEAIKAINFARKAFDRLSFDLIYALPNQTLADLKYNLNYAFDLDVDHISLYQLTIEANTKFYHMYQRQEFVLPDNTLAGDMYDMVNQCTADHGYRRYEISNYAKINQESRHNMCYWNYDEYLGLGPGAHSRILDKNVNQLYAMHMIYSPQGWLNSVHDNQHGIKDKTFLLNKEIFTEIMMMGLRTKRGVSNSKVLMYLGKNTLDLLEKTKLDNLRDAALLTYNDEYVKLTDAGLNLHNHILQLLI